MQVTGIEEVGFTFGAMVFRRPVARGTMTTEVTFSPWDLRGGVVATVRRDDQDGTREILRRIEVPVPTLERTAALHAAVAQAVAGRSSLRAATRDEAGEEVELGVAFLGEGVVLFSQDTGDRVATIGFGPVDEDAAEAGYWARVDVEETPSGCTVEPRAALVRNFAEAESFLASHGIGMSTGEPQAPLPASGPRMR